MLYNNHLKMKKLIIFTLLLPMFVIAQDDCKGISKDKDKFADPNYPTYSSPIFFRPFRIIKMFSKSDPPTTFAIFEAAGNTPTMDGKSIILLLLNGEKIEIPAEVKVSVNTTRGGDSYKYTAYITINDELNNKLIQTQITDYRIYIFDVKLTKKMSQDFQQYLNCLKAITH